MVTSKKVRRPPHRPKGSGGWQQLSKKLSRDWEAAAGLLETEHNTSLPELMAQALIDDPLRGLQVLSSYIPNNVKIDMEVSGGTYLDALTQVQTIIDAQARTIDDAHHLPSDIIATDVEELTEQDK
jgi:hypothetical protein